MAKCASTTSAGLGVRLGGMQVFRQDLSSYCCRDKYFGRKLNEDGLREALHDFFHDGLILKVMAIRSVLKKLQSLKEAIEKQSSFRFYSTSLLIAYEGASVPSMPSSRQQHLSHLLHASGSADMGMLHATGAVAAAAAAVRPAGSRTDVKMIDFAHSIVGLPSQTTRSASSTTTQANGTVTGVGTSASVAAGSPAAVTPSVPLLGTCNSSHHQHPHHQGPDQGFLKGLNSLIRLLQQILDMEGGCDDDTDLVVV